MSDIDLNFNRETDVPPDKPVEAGYYDAIVAGVKFEKLESAVGSLPQGCEVARIQYRIESDNPDYSGKYIRPFPIPVRGHKDSWRWFDWCGRMGYDTKAGFSFSENDVVNTPVVLKFAPPRAGKDGKMYDALETVERKV